MQDTTSSPDPCLTHMISMLAPNQFAMAIDRMRQIATHPTPTAQPTPPLDPGDPVAQALQLMHQDGNLPPNVSAHDTIPAESHVRNLISNFTNNARAWGGHGLAGQAI